MRSISSRHFFSKASCSLSSRTGSGRGRSRRVRGAGFPLLVELPDHAGGETEEPHDFRDVVPLLEEIEAGGSDLGGRIEHGYRWRWSAWGRRPRFERLNLLRIEEMIWPTTTGASSPVSSILRTVGVDFPSRSAT